MSFPDEFSEVVRYDEPLAPYTWLKIGGPAQYFVEPRDVDELERVIRACTADDIPVRLLGGGSNLLVRDEGVGGAVLKLTAPAFAEVTVSGTEVHAGGGALLSRVVSHSVQAGLAGLEALVGIPGTVGGALHGNAGGKNGDIGQFVKSVSVMTAQGERCRRTEDELSFGYRSSSINELVVIDVELALSEDDPAEITRRMRKLWILKKSSQPFSFQSAGCVFKNPRGLSAGALIEQSGLKGTQVGQCVVSERHGNFLVANEGARSSDALRLIELVRTKVRETHGIDLELEIEVW